MFFWEEVGRAAGCRPYQPKLKEQLSVTVKLSSATLVKLICVKLICSILIDISYGINRFHATALFICYLMFSGGIERDQLHEMCYKPIQYGPFLQKWMKTCCESNVATNCKNQIPCWGNGNSFQLRRRSKSKSCPCCLTKSMFPWSLGNSVVKVLWKVLKKVS